MVFTKSCMGLVLQMRMEKGGHDGLAIRDNNSPVMTLLRQEPEGDVDGHVFG